jgi:murein DD-endopeptidase MepM/ murein hydrolase activator NlpD
MTRSIKFVIMSALIAASFNTLAWCKPAAKPAPPPHPKITDPYYRPWLMWAPLRDDMAYSPVGMGLVTSNAGYRTHPVTGQHGSFHSGVDLSAKLNDKVYCLLDGVVTRVGWRGNLGVAVEVYHPAFNLSTITGHMNAYFVLPNQWIRRGTVVGYAGSTGRSTGVHVHYTVLLWPDRQYVDPMAFLREVPDYVKAMKTAGVQMAAARNIEAFKKAPPKAQPTHSDKDDLPEGESEAAPPGFDAL